MRHFGRRFDDLATEVTLMETRLASGTGDARKIKSPAALAESRCPPPPCLGDVDALADRLAAIRRPRRGGRRRRPDAGGAPRRADRPQGGPGAEAEEIAANATQWKAAGDRMRAILDEWRTITGLDRKTDDALWKRYSAARDAFNRRRGAHFAELGPGTPGREAKERLCVRAEALSESRDWAPTANTFRDPS